MMNFDSACFAFIWGHGLNIYWMYSTSTSPEDWNKISQKIFTNFYLISHVRYCCVISFTVWFLASHYFFEISRCEWNELKFSTEIEIVYQQFWTNVILKFFKFSPVRLFHLPFLKIRKRSLNDINLIIGHCQLFCPNSNRRYFGFGFFLIDLKIKSMQFQKLE